MLQSRPMTLDRPRPRGKRRGRIENPATLAANVTEAVNQIIWEPTRILKVYEVQAHRVEPIGVVYLWPISG